MSKLTFNIDRVISGHVRLTDEQALELYHHPSLHDLGQWAHAVTQRMHPQDYRTYVIDRNINYTNVCTAKCTFCAFRRDHEDSDSYTLSYEKIGEKIRELVSINGTQILMQGGMNDRLPIEWYEDLLRYIKDRIFRRCTSTLQLRRSLSSSSGFSRWMCARSSGGLKPRDWQPSPAVGGRFSTRACGDASASASAAATIGCA